MEIKSGRIDPIEDLKWLKHFGSLAQFKGAQKICLGNNVSSKNIDGIGIVNWQQGPEELFAK